MVSTCDGYVKHSPRKPEGPPILGVLPDNSTQSQPVNVSRQGARTREQVAWFFHNLGPRRKQESRWKVVITGAMEWGKRLQTPEKTPKTIFPAVWKGAIHSERVYISDFVFALRPQSCLVDLRHSSWPPLEFRSRQIRRGSFTGRHLSVTSE